MSAKLCTSCTRPCADAYVCTRCVNELAGDLGDIPALSGHLATTYARQSRFGSGVGSRSTDDAPMIFDPRASAAGRMLRATLEYWVDQTDGRKTGNVRQLVAHLMSNLERIRHHPNGARAVSEIAHDVDRVKRVIDRPEDRWYAGPCDVDECDGELYAKPEAAKVACPVCRVSYAVDDRRTTLLERAAELLAPAALLARALTALGQEVTPELVRTWEARGRLVARGVDLEGRPMFRVGDVQELLIERVNAAERRRLKYAQRSA